MSVHIFNSIDSCSKQIKEHCDALRSCSLPPTWCVGGCLAGAGPDNRAGTRCSWTASHFCEPRVHTNKLYLFSTYIAGIYYKSDIVKQQFFITEKSFNHKIILLAAEGLFWYRLYSLQFFHSIGGSWQGLIWHLKNIYRPKCYVNTQISWLW